jgi:hypothetical protein
MMSEWEDVLMSFGFDFDSLNASWQLANQIKPGSKQANVPNIFVASTPGTTAPSQQHRHAHPINLCNSPLYLQIFSQWIHTRQKEVRLLLSYA